jgi:transglutaminase-like putative cysteine protease
MIAEPMRVRGSITQASLRLMQDLIEAWGKHPFTVQLARAIAAKAGAKTPEDEAWAVWAWVRSHVTYRADPVDTQWIQDPYETAVKSRAGNCANMTVLGGALLWALGHPTKATAVWWTDRDDYTHAVAQDLKTGRVVDSVSPTFEWPPFGKQVHGMMAAA